MKGSGRKGGRTQSRNVKVRGPKYQRTADNSMHWPLKRFFHPIRSESPVFTRNRQEAGFVALGVCWPGYDRVRLSTSAMMFASSSLV